MGEHTPGPWEAIPFSDALEGDGVMVCGRVYNVCDCYGENVSANAYLIAAAPDLLALAELAEAKPKEVQAIMEEHDFVIDDLDDRWQKFAFTLYNMLVALACRSEVAIAKAKGE